MENYLVISAVGSNRDGLVDALAKAIKDAGCNILDSRMAVLGGEFSMMLLLVGAWDAIVKVEGTLPRLEAKHGIKFVSKRTEARKPGPSLMPYAVDVVSSDHSGIVYDIAKFFSDREIGIEDMYTSSYPAVHSGTRMFSLHMTLSVPTNNSIATLRGEFMDLCDNLNLDAVMEPVK